jgi:hypothetical protein
MGLALWRVAADRDELEDRVSTLVASDRCRVRPARSSVPSGMSRSSPRPRCRARRCYRPSRRTTRRAPTGLSGDRGWAASHRLPAGFETAVPARRSLRPPAQASAATRPAPGARRTRRQPPRQTLIGAAAVAIILIGPGVAAHRSGPGGPLWSSTPGGLPQGAEVMAADDRSADSPGKGTWSGPVASAGRCGGAGSGRRSTARGRLRSARTRRSRVGLSRRAGSARRRRGRGPRGRGWTRAARGCGAR